MPLDAPHQWLSRVPDALDQSVLGPGTRDQISRVQDALVMERVDDETVPIDFGENAVGCEPHLMRSHLVSGRVALVTDGVGQMLMQGSAEMNGEQLQAAA